MRIHNLMRLFTIIGIGMFISVPQKAFAQFPTFDIAAIKEGITSNIEMVKQSKVMTDATETAGKINSGIGDAKGSASKFSGDNLAKAQEKMEKLQEEKKRIEEKKKKYDEYQGKLEEKKKEMEEYKARAEKAKAEAKDAKEMAKGAKDMAKGTVDDAKSTVTDAKGAAADNQNQAEEEASSQQDEREQAVETPQIAPPNSDNKVYADDTLPQDLNLDQTTPVALAADERVVAEEVTSGQEADALYEDANKLKEEQNALDQEKAELDVDMMFAKTPEEKAAVEAKMKDLDARYDELHGRMDENSAQLSAVNNKLSQEASQAEAEVARTSGEAEKASLGRQRFGEKTLQAIVPEAKKEIEAEKLKVDEAMPLHRPKILDGETSEKSAIPESHRPKILDEYEAQRASKASGGFRKRAVPLKSSSVEFLPERRVASQEFSETLVFAEAGMDAMPDGTVNGVFIFSDRLATECEINVKDLEDEKVMNDCIKKIVNLKSRAEASLAQEGNAIYKTIMQETVNALIAESMAQKNVAANYEEKVLTKMEKDISNTKNSRDDTGGLSITNKELQFLLNRILTVYSAQLSLDALQKVGGFDSSGYDEDSKEGDGEKK